MIREVTFIKRRVHHQYLSENFSKERFVRFTADAGFPNTYHQEMHHVNIPICQSHPALSTATQKFWP